MNNPIKVKPIQRDLLYTKIADAIMEYIKENDLKTGDRIPSERELAQEFNTSRNSVREALRVLENNGIIEVKMCLYFRKKGRELFLSQGVES